MDHDSVELCLCWHRFQHDSVLCLLSQVWTEANTDDEVLAMVVRTGWLML